MRKIEKVKWTGRKGWTGRTGRRDHYEQRRCTLIYIDLLRGRTGKTWHTGDRTDMTHRRQDRQGDVGHPFVQVIDLAYVCFVQPFLSTTIRQFGRRGQLQSTDKCNGQNRQTGWSEDGADGGNILWTDGARQIGEEGTGKREGDIKTVSAIGDINDLETIFNTSYQNDNIPLSVQYLFGIHGFYISNNSLVCERFTSMESQTFSWKQQRMKLSHSLRH